MRQHAFGKYLREKRLAARITTVELADHLGIASVALSSIERGLQGPLPETYWEALVRAVPTLDVNELRAKAAESVLRPDRRAGQDVVAEELVDAERALFAVSGLSRDRDEPLAVWLRRAWKQAQKGGAA